MAAPTPAPAPVASAPAPVTYAEVAPVAVAAAPAGTSSAPVSPATNALIQRNIALSGGIDAMGYVPHKYADKSFASFQWSGTNSATAWAAFDTWAASFRVNNGAGDLAGYWLKPDLGLGAVVSFRRQRTTTVETTPNAGTNGDDVVETTVEDTVYAADGLELLASKPFGDLHAYANVHARSLGSGDMSYEVTGADVPDQSTASRNYRAGVTIGVRTYAAPNGSAWQLQASYDYDYLRASGEDESNLIHRFRVNGRWGQRKDVDGFAIAYGVNPVFSHVDGKAAPDVRDTLSLPPNLALEIPLFQNWTLKGGATLPLAMVYDDAVAGDDEGSVWSLRTDSPTGNVGLRYGRGRWAAEAGVSNGFLAAGPYFLSGNTGAGTLVDFALVVNFD